MSTLVKQRISAYPRSRLVDDWRLSRNQVTSAVGTLCLQYALDG